MPERLEAVDLSGLHLESPVMNGAGPVKLPEQVFEVARSKASAVVLGSITVDERLGNQGRTYYSDNQRGFTLNSKGLPNPGSEYYKEHLPEMVQIAHDNGKPLIVSAAGFSPQEYAVLAGIILESGADGVELNLGCPNVWGKDGKQKRITSFDEDLTGETLFEVGREVGSNDWVEAKLSPYSDPIVLRSIANILAASKYLKAVGEGNTFPNGFYFDDQGEATIDPGGGFAGVAGDALKPIALGQVKQLREVLPQAIAVIGVGGISSRRDVDDYLRVGTSAVQITSAYVNFGPEIFEKVQESKTS